MVTPFEYVTVLISIILGMGLTQLVSGFAAIIIRWEKVKIYWPHIIFILLVFILHIQDWWATFELRAFNDWRLPTFLFIILYPVNLYILARILFPIRWSNKQTDLKKFYFDNYRKIYLFMTFLPVHSIIDNHFIGGYSFKDQILQMFILGILGSVLIFRIEAEWVHKTIVIGFLLILGITFGIAWNTFLISIK